MSWHCSVDPRPQARLRPRALERHLRETPRAGRGPQVPTRCGGDSSHPASGFPWAPTFPGGPGGLRAPQPWPLLTFLPESLPGTLRPQTYKDQKFSSNCENSVYEPGEGPAGERPRLCAWGSLALGTACFGDRTFWSPPKSRQFSPVFLGDSPDEVLHQFDLLEVEQQTCFGR